MGAGVSDTAFWTAFCRAEESKRSNPRLIDPLAADLCGEEGLRIGRDLEAVGLAHDAIIARTCVIDERIGAAIAGGMFETVIVLGAGLDARPFRLRLPPTLRWI